MAGPVNQEGSVPVLQSLLGSRVWWLGLVLAVASYLGLHWWAAMPPPQLTAGAPIAPLVAVTMSRMLADFAQYIVPVVVLFMAGLLALRNASDVTDLSTAARGRAAMAAMDWPAFSALLSEFFRHQGFRVVEGSNAGPEGRADMMLQRGSERFVVRSRLWHAQRVGVQPVRELFSVIASSHAAGGFMVTSGIFTPEAHLFARGREVVLVDGQTLHETIRKQSNQAAEAAPQRT